ncbi:MAG: hypothetical protein NFW16_09600 [Candidatus Accumulibacter sp.]|uniref:hypothetical protein n=1 Tax=Accumulibacter sp. TaxID=2053492 RepID=UPI00258A056E|nr:hypothetical protein [Accumulibacter sp.]MCM8621973.1 hypothetical protein [Accumulibacter sp.]
MLPRLQALRRQIAAFFLRNFVIGDEDALPLAIVDGIEQIDCVERRSAPREKICQQGIGLVAHHSGNGIAHGVDGFRE